MDPLNKTEKGLRITTWNVNGIRNPFSYQPWNQEKSFSTMFDILKADIVVMQETKIQQKDLRDEMVLIPGWDAYFSFPKYKRGYSGVAIFTRNAVCAPIRAEEGITGILPAPKSTTSFRDLSVELQIGGYPTHRQLSECFSDAATLDCEGRCVILEFPAFVLIGTYCPAARDESREDFRLDFLKALDARVRNLVNLGKNVFVTGDLNITMDVCDSAHTEDFLRKSGILKEELLSTPTNRIMHQLLVNGKVFEKRDRGRENPVLVDLCRNFHPTRSKMFTCWDQKRNARPGNFGSRIDYVLCSKEMKDWFCESNIQEGLMGSDHCPVYAVLNNVVNYYGNAVHIKDIMSSSMFKHGVRLREWSTKDVLPLSARLLPEFDRRRNIKDMFVKRQKTCNSVKSKINCVGGETDCSFTSKQSITLSQGKTQQNLSLSLTKKGDEISLEEASINPEIALDNPENPETPSSGLAMSTKRENQTSNIPTYPSKRHRSSVASKTLDQKNIGKQQKTLAGFFATKVPEKEHIMKGELPLTSDTESNAIILSLKTATTPKSLQLNKPEFDQTKSSKECEISLSYPEKSTDKDVSNSIAAKENWSKLFTKRTAPRCEHDEPCIIFVSKKPGMNQGRSFYICPMPLGPSGEKEKNTPWRCGTFIWCSDWNGNTA